MSAFLGLGRFFNRSIIINNACSDNEMVLFWDRNFAFLVLEKMGRRNIDCISAVDEVFGTAVPASGLRKLSIELSSSEWMMVFVWKAAGRWAMDELQRLDEKLIHTYLQQIPRLFRLL
jgi:hypothetical protein